MVRYRAPSKAVQKLGFRSKLEAGVNQQLVDSGIKFSYEGKLNKIKYVKPVTHHTYMSDFLLENGIIIEAKGFFDVSDRKKHLYIKEQYPEFDIRFLFMNSNSKIRKRSPTSYAKWCDKHGFRWADKVIPEAWLKEKKSKVEVDTIIKLLKEMNI